ncbi:ATPase [Sphingomonas lutea]|uniref:ATPase n=1 Tax=Sphingomonas lutea TaxID=1045317 RepID=A0A7G9SH93_9SPHN|nr:ATPase [Sphingomonas lutea]QNN67218.1 ATPase [Sphingomonas lutea]
MRYLAGLAMLVATPASADVVGASSNGFELAYTVNLTVKPDVAYSAFANVPAWWNADHTYSGDSKNLSLALNPGGCFCERFPKGGGIEHMRVTYVDPGKRIVMTGSLGPLLYDATSGVMDIQVKSQAGGSQLTLNYRAAGFAKGNAAASAPLVDKVLADQLRRYRAFAVSRPRT